MSTERTPSDRREGRRVWRTALRIAFQGLVALAAAAPLIYTAITSDNPEAAVGSAAVVLGVAGALTRVMSIPIVDRFFRVTLPWIASHREMSLSRSGTKTPDSGDQSEGFMAQEVTREPLSARGKVTESSPGEPH